MEISIVYNDLDWLLIVDEYDYIESQEEGGPTYASGGEPYFAEEIEFVSYYIELNDSSFSDKFIEMINAQLYESSKLCDHILDCNDPEIYEKALRIHHDL